MYDLKYKPSKPEAVFLLNSGALAISTHQPPSCTLKPRTDCIFISSRGDSGWRPPAQALPKAGLPGVLRALSFLCCRGWRPWRPHSPSGALLQHCHHCSVKNVLLSCSADPDCPTKPLLGGRCHSRTRACVGVTWYFCCPLSLLGYRVPRKEAASVRTARVPRCGVLLSEEVAL